MKAKLDQQPLKTKLSILIFILDHRYYMTLFRSLLSPETNLVLLPPTKQTINTCMGTPTYFLETISLTSPAEMVKIYRNNSNTLMVLFSPAMTIFRWAVFDSTLFECHAVPTELRKRGIYLRLGQWRPAIMVNWTLVIY